MEAGDGGFLQHSDPNLNGFLDGLNNMSADLLDAELLEATSLLPSLSKDDPALQHNKTEQQNSYAHRAHYGQHAPPAMASPEQSAAAGAIAGPHGPGVPSPPDTEATTSASTVKRSRQQAEEAHDDSTKHRASSSRATRQRRKANSAQEEKSGTPHAQQMPTQAEPQGGLHQQQFQPPMEQQQSEQHNYIGRNSSMPLKQQQHDPAGRAFSVPPHRDSNVQQSTTISEPELKQAYCNSVQALKDYITVTNLLSYDILGKNLPEKLTGDLKTLIHQISKVCLQAIKPDTPYVINVISKDYSQATTVDWELDKGHWTNVIAHLQLTENQVLAILRARSAHVDKLMGLYHERAVLAKQAADLAAASCTQGNARLGVEDHSMLGILMRHGYLYCARNVITLHRGLELMRDTLGREQKVVMELFLNIVYQVLSPVQAALFVVESFPYHCDVLAMSNVLSMMYGSKLDAMAPMGPDMGMHNAGLHGPMSSMGSMQDLQRSMSLVNGGTPTANGGAPMRGDGLARLRSFLDTATQPPFSVDNMMGPAGNLQSNRAMSFGGPMGPQPLQSTNSRPLAGMPGIDSMTPMGMGMGMGMHGMGGPPIMGIGPYPGLQHAGSIKQPNGMPSGGMPGLQGPGMPGGNMQSTGLGLDMQSMGSGDMPMSGPQSSMGPRGSMPNPNMLNGRASMSLPSDGGPSGQGGMMSQMGNDSLSGLLPLDLAGMGGGKQVQGRNGPDSMLPPQGMAGNPGMGMPGVMGTNGNNATLEGSSGFPGSPARGGKQGHVIRNPNSNAPSGFGTGPGARLLGSGGNIPGMGGPLGPGNGMHSGLPTISSGHNVGLNSSLSRELSSGMTAEMAQAYRNFSKGANGMHAPSSPMVDLRGMGMDTRNGNMSMGMETNARMGLGGENRSAGGIDMRGSGGVDVRGLSMEVRGPSIDMGMLSMPGGMERYNSSGRPPSGHGGVQVDMSKGMYGVDMSMQRSPLHAQQGQQQQGQQQGQQQQQQPPGQQQQQGSSSPLLPQGSNGFGRGASAGSNPGTGMSQLSQGGRSSQPSSVTMNNMLPGSMVDMSWAIGNPSNGNGISNANGKLTSMCSGLNTLGLPPNTLAVPPPGPSHANPMNGAGGPGGKSMQGNGGSGNSLPVISVPKEPS